MKHRVGVLLLQDNAVLLIRRYRAERGVYYVVPGGGVEEGEGDEEGAVREMREETGFEVELGRIVYRFEYPEYNQLQIFYSGKIIGGALSTEIGGPEREYQSNENVYEVGWVPIDEVSRLPLYPEGIKEVITELNI
jgi:8-oxo-dGTP pyrophosphatase MutT (NUDIX family)